VVPDSLRFTAITVDGKPFDAAVLAGKPVDSHAADDCGSRNGSVNGDCIELLDDLSSELAGRGDYQRASGSSRPVYELVENRKEKSRCLAAAG
jgi:hypothetical protein